MDENGYGIAADYTLTPDQLEEVLLKMVPKQLPTMIWGPPGVGKSHVCREVANKLGAEYIDIRALLMDPVEWRGIPYHNKETNVMSWAPPEFLPPSDSDGLYVINLDEITAAPPMTQASLYQLVWDRSIGDYHLPPGAAIVACGNRETDRGVAYKMPTPLASRFATHIEVMPEPAAWCSWAAKNGIASEVIFFIQMDPDILHQFDPKKDKDHSFPCPRTWASVSEFVDSMDGMDLDIQSAVFRGAVGEAAGTKFSAFLKIWRSLPHPQTIIDDPDGAPVPEDPVVQIALCGSLYKMADDHNFDSIVRYGMRLRPELTSFMVRSAVKANAVLMHTKAYIDWTCQNAD